MEDSTSNFDGDFGLRDSVNGISKMLSCEANNIATVDDAFRIIRNELMKQHEYSAVRPGNESGEMEIVNEVRDVWGGHSDFKDGGFNYVAFVIREDLREMEESGWNQSTCTREMRDVVINSLRSLDELSDEAVVPGVIDRVKEHDEKNTVDIIEKYQHLYENRL